MRKAVIGFFILALLTGAHPLLGQKVSLNFDEVDIAVFLQTMSEITGKSFVASDNVKGKISFVSSEDVPASKVYPIVLSILEARGFQAVPGKGDIIHIYPAQEALTVLEALPLRVQPPIDNVHRFLHQIGYCGFSDPPPRSDQFACLTRMYHSTSRRTWRSV